MLCVYYASGPDSAEFKSHADRITDYLWLGLDGMKMQGYNGSQLWDTAFSVQAIHFSKSSVNGKYNHVLQQAYDYLNSTQVVEEVPTPNRHYRHVSVGAWPFSTRDHGWPISDCTAEGLKAVLYLNNSKDFQPNNRISDERLFDATNVILSLQNRSGGWATYEQQRTTGLIELLNPSETFHGIMVDYPYIECSSACVQALLKFAHYYPSHRSSEIQLVVFFYISISSSLLFLPFPLSSFPLSPFSSLFLPSPPPCFTSYSSLPLFPPSPFPFSSLFLPSSSLSPSVNITFPPFFYGLPLPMLFFSFSYSLFYILLQFVLSIIFPFYHFILSPVPPSTFPSSCSKFLCM